MPRAPTGSSALLEFADSELAAIERVGPDLRLRFAAARVWQDGEAGFAIGLVLLLLDAAAPPCAEFGALESGWLRGPGQGSARTRLPLLPCDGPLRLALTWRRGGLQWQAEAQGLRVLEPGRRQADWSC